MGDFAQGMQAVIEDLKPSLESHGLHLSEDGMVRWDKNNPDHPRNWATWRKTYDIGVILFLEFVTSMNGTAGTAAAEDAQRTYGVSRSLSIFAFTSTYLLGQGVGGVFFPPFSESFGRKSLYITSTLGYCIFSAVTAAVPSLAAAAVCRFITGILSAVPTVVVAGSIEDMFNMQARVWMIFSWIVLGNLGVVIGSIYSTWISVKLGWRWVFYTTAIVIGCLFVLCFFLKESRPSLLLQRKVSKLRQVAEFENLEYKNPDVTLGFRVFIRTTLIRPIHLLFTEPIIMIIAAMGSLACLMLYLQAESFLVVYQSLGFSEADASLAQIPIAIGCLLGILTRWYDHRLLSKRRRSGKVLEPEDKLFGFAIGAPIMACSLWWFAWTIPPKVHADWKVSMASLILTGYAINEFIYCLSSYLADSYTIYAASAFAGLLLTRSFATAVALIFSHQMYTDIPANDATSILAAIATVFCVAPYVLIRHGKRIRESSVFACYSLETYQQHTVEDDMNVGLVLLESDQAC